MTRIIALALAITAGTMAQASDDYIKIDPAKTQQIETLLTEQGYDVRKIEMDDGLYEAYALKDGARYEIYLDSNLTVVKTEIDD
ncbi:PepSY domain-containing protein [Roseovarius sp. PS-C2]|uniref:PepSY domain-containing protein n=1 Tax=Roseovarius sp. PS-C2 TaxID=2820814 RepID=UPI001C0B0046|nr:PepSY domain-containing protein [Roseovarius sp. PS-C2]MBU3258451.1 PepSY domain-containing protein [Roseovarius sp. PS-C2]